ncbi:MAG: uroporphyrinogen-III synthase [Bacteroidaceae bacterium]|nr:uroporphyrinogen-III synthase [Bacteroidaceae bacterium]
MIKKILVSQPKPSTEKSPYFDIEERFGVNIVFRPFIKVERLTPREFRQQKINLADFTAVIFTSRNSIDHFFQLCQEMRYQVPEAMKYFCVTETISHYIQHYVQYRKRKVFWGSTGKVDDLIPQMLRHKNDRYFVPMSDVHNDDIKNLLDSKKLDNTEGIMYRTVANDFSEEEARTFDYDMLVFFSPSGIRSLLKNFPDFKERQGDCVIAAFGSTTCQAVHEAGLRLDIEAPSENCPSMPMAICRYLCQFEEG